jgi:hypothetical protein
LLTFAFYLICLSRVELTLPSKTCSHKELVKFLLWKQSNTYKVNRINFQVHITSFITCLVVSSVIFLSVFNFYQRFTFVQLFASGNIYVNWNVSNINILINESIHITSTSLSIDTTFPSFIVNNLNLTFYLNFNNWAAKSWSSLHTTRNDR